MFSFKTHYKNFSTTLGFYCYWVFNTAAKKGLLNIVKTTEPNFMKKKNNKPLCSEYIIKISIKLFDWSRVHCQIVWNPEGKAKNIDVYKLLFTIPLQENTILLLFLDRKFLKEALAYFSWQNGIYSRNYKEIFHKNAFFYQLTLKPYTFSFR